MSFIENLIIEKSGYYRETVLSRKPLHYREGFEKLISSSDFEKIIEKVSSRYIISILIEKLDSYRELEFLDKFQGFR